MQNIEFARKIDLEDYESMQEELRRISVSVNLLRRVQNRMELSDLEELI